MKAVELRKETPEALNATLEKLGKSLFSLRMRRGMGQTVKPHEFNVIKKDIARVKTILTEFAKKDDAK